MKTYEVYFGEVYFAETLTEDMELLSKFNSMEEAESFICQQIKEKHQPNYYIRIAQNKNLKWYDYGSHTQFYVIKIKD